jgi:hypothetical protein
LGLYDNALESDNEDYEVSDLSERPKMTSWIQRVRSFRNDRHSHVADIPLPNVAFPNPGVPNQIRYVEAPIPGTRTEPPIFPPSSFGGHQARQSAQIQNLVQAERAASRVGAVTLAVERDILGLHSLKDITEKVDITLECTISNPDEDGESGYAPGSTNGDYIPEQLVGTGALGHDDSSAVKRGKL